MLRWRFWRDAKRSCRGFQLCLRGFLQAQNLGVLLAFLLLCVRGRLLVSPLLPRCVVLGQKVSGCSWCHCTVTGLSTDLCLSAAAGQPGACCSLVVRWAKFEEDWAVDGNERLSCLLGGAVTTVPVGWEPACQLGTGDVRSTCGRS